MKPSIACALAGVAAAFGVVAVPVTLRAQGTPAAYARATGLRARYEGAAIDIAGPPTAIGRTHTFWYRVMTGGVDRFVVVDADTGRKGPAFDHDRIAASLSAATGKTYTSRPLPFATVVFSDDGAAFTASVDGAPYRCRVADSSCARDDETGAGGRRRQDEGPRVSPDGKWEAIVNNFNVAVRRVGSPALARLSTDGSEGNYYDLHSIVWSPDSTKVVAYRVKPGYHREIHYIESSPEDQLQPKFSSLRYAKPGDVLDVDRPVLFHLDPARQMVVDDALFPNAYANSALVWRKDSRAFTFEYNQRGHQVYRVIEVDAATGRARAVVSEEPKTFFNYRGANGSLADSGKKFRDDIDDGKEVIWMSERDGWNHLYLYDGATGAVKNQITRGDWVVRGVQHVDPATAPNLVQRRRHGPGQGSRTSPTTTGSTSTARHLTRLTAADADHSVAYSADMQYYVDTYSRIDLPPVVELRRTADNGLVSTLERGDITALVKAGWTPPEVFVAKGRDGADRHLGRHHPADHLRRVEALPGHRVHLRRTAGFVRPEDVRRLEPDAVAGRARVRRGPDRRDGHVESLEGVSGRGVAQPGRRGISRSHPLAPGGGGEVPAGTTSRASASTAARPAVRTRSAACCSTRNSTSQGSPTRAATTTGWTRSGGTNSGWAGRSGRSTPPLPTWTMRTGCRATCCSSSASSTRTSIPRPRCRW